MVDLVRSLVYPFSKLENIVDFLLLAILSAFWYAVLPVIFVNGYLVKVIRNAVEGKEDLPDWPGFKLSGWWNMFKKGIGYSVIMIIYFAIPFAIAFFATFNGVSFWLIMFSLLALFAVAAILPMALVYYAATEKFSQAFNFPVIIASIIKKVKTYLLIYLITAVLFAAALFIASYLSYFGGFVLIFPVVFGMTALAKLLAETQ
jgi:hypothetical protein